MISTTRTRALVAALATTALLAGCNAGSGTTTSTPGASGGKGAGTDPGSTTSDGEAARFAELDAGEPGAE